ncbi:MAG: CAP domain-containing protein [Candidatus Parcubacteria bacterium]|nr:CAP domain-containing protein [Candidatus Parcubacteria bacterium]
MLKDLFIPHRLNSYQPHILHPKRLLFHGTAAVLIKVFVLVSLLVLPASGWLTPDVMTEQSQEIISLTNQLRQNSKLEPLTESAALNQAAYNKVQDMIIGQYFSHLSPSKQSLADWLKSVNYPYAVAGENLAMGFSSAKQVVAAWQKSKTHNANLLDPDFKEIGVAMTSNTYKKHDTTMVAQYFGTQKIVVSQALKENVVPAVTQLKTVSISNSNFVLPSKSSVQGVKIETDNVLIDNTPPTIDLMKTKIYLNQPLGQKDKVIQVIAYLSSDAVVASANFGNYYVELQKDAQANVWFGNLIIPAQDAEAIFDPVVLASLTAWDAAGNTITSDIDWANIETIKPSLIKQYLFIKNSSSWGVKTLVGASKVYFSLLLIIGIIALFLNIFIEIKKQHSHIILSTLCLITLLAFLIIL